MKSEDEIKVRRWECYSPAEDDLPPEKGHEKTIREIREMGGGLSSCVHPGLIVLLVVVVMFQVFMVPGRLEFYLHLLSGWSFFAWRALSSVRIDYMALANGIVGIVVACVVLHWLLVKCLGRSEIRPDGWRLRLTLRIAMGVVVVFAMCVVTIGLVTSVGWYLKPNGIRTQNRSHVRTLVQFARMHAEQQAGRIPDERPGIYGGESDLYTQFYHEGLSQPPECFIWFGKGLSITNTPGDIPLAAAPQKYADGTRLVAFLDESVKECTEEEWQAALDRWRRVKEGMVREGHTDAK
ncbi:MAG: hypothetical protein ACAH88_06835 [Roseimicrobium sp.]